MTSTFTRALIATSFIIAGASAARADSAGVTFSSGDKFTEKSGEDIYRNVCQACHMDKGQGAVGAGAYPALAKNEGLEEPSYPIYIVLHGQKGMPGFGSMLDDEQVAAVVTYIRSNFGNNYKDTVSAEAVKDSR